MNDNFLIVNTKLMRVLKTCEDHVGKPIKIETGKNIHIMLMTDSTITPFEKAVLDTLCTFEAEMQKTFSYGDIMRNLTGEEKATLTGQRKQWIEEALANLQSTNIKLDCTNELRARKAIMSNEYYQYEGPLIKIEKASKTKYKIAEPIAVNDYAMQIKQLISPPVKLLQCRDDEGKKIISDTKEGILLKRAIINKLEIMRANPKSHSSNLDIITFQSNAGVAHQYRGIYQEDITGNLRKSVSKSDKNRYHNQIQDILNYFCDIGYIDRYRELKEKDNKTWTGFKIMGNIANPWDIFRKK